MVHTTNDIISVSIQFDDDWRGILYHNNRVYRCLRPDGSVSPITKCNHRLSPFVSCHSRTCIVDARHCFFLHVFVFVSQNKNTGTFKKLVVHVTLITASFLQFRFQIKKTSSDVDTCQEKIASVSK
jgi:hypothetical protein